MLTSFLTPVTVFAASIVKMQQAGILREKVQLTTHSGQLTPAQQIIATHLETACQSAKTLFAQQILEMQVSADLELINQWLVERKSPKKFERSGNQNTIYVAAHYRQPIKFSPPGKPDTVVSIDNEVYPAIKLDTDYVQVFNVDGTDDHVIVVRDGKGRGDLYFSTVEEPLADKTALLKLILERQQHLTPTRSFQNIYIPMLQMTGPIDMAFCEGLVLRDESGREVPTVSFMVEAQFNMNQYGALAQAWAVFEEQSLSVGYQEDLIFKKPFAMWIRQGFSALPIMHGFVGYNCWKNPGILRF
ncbi:hypothetical protein KAZ66_01690 [Candidatus Woesebacteria bacterium]|nr:hypothetical protein [Candidatus Woesebacteria bacterium]